MSTATVPETAAVQAGDCFRAADGVIFSVALTPAADAERVDGIWADGRADALTLEQLLGSGFARISC